MANSDNNVIDEQDASSTAGLALPGFPGGAINSTTSAPSPSVSSGTASTGSGSANSGSLSGAGDAGSGDAAAALQAKLDAQAPGRYQVLDPQTAQRLALQQRLDAQSPGRYQVLSPSDLDHLPPSAFSDITDQAEQANDDSGGALGTVADLARETAGGVYKGIGQALRGTGEFLATVADHTTTPVINWIFGTNFKDANPANGAADAVENFASKVQAGVSKVTANAIKNSQPSGDLLKPSTWSLGTDPSVRGYAMMGADLLGSAAPLVLATSATGGSAAAGAIAGGIQGGGGAAEHASALVVAGCIPVETAASSICAVAFGFTSKRTFPVCTTSCVSPTFCLSRNT